jgi:hypothetical protein
VQHHPADQLNVEVAHPQDTLAGFAHDGEGLRQEIVQGLTGVDAHAECVFLGTQLGVRKRRDLVLERVHPFDDRTQPLERPLVLRAHDLGEKSVDHEGLLYQTEASGLGRSGGAMRP